MFYEYAKKAIKRAFRLVGLEVRRHQSKGSRSEQKTDRDLPPLIEHPLEALAYHQGGKRSAFECPLGDTVQQNGLQYGLTGWHPFVETLREYAAGECLTYEGSILEQYYEVHQPTHAAAAILGFDQAPDVFHQLPPHLYRLTPWRSKSAETIDREVRQWTLQHGQSYGHPDLSLEAHGYQYHGPVSHRKGKLEYQRLTRLYEQIRTHGYDRRRGHAHFLMLQRGDTYRFLAKGDGNHRIAVMAALGYETIPAVFILPFIVTIEMVDYWTQVCRGVWTCEQAVAYMNHLFDFNPREWARQQGAGLVVEQ